MRKNIICVLVFLLVFIGLVLPSVSLLHAEDLNLMGIENAPIRDGNDAFFRTDQSYAPKRFVIVDNTFFGISGCKDLRDYFRDRGWEAEYKEDTWISEMYKIAKNTDILYIITHAGVRQRDRQVGFVWRTFMGIKRNQVTADQVAEKMKDGPHPKLVIIAGCEAGVNRSMADAFGGDFIGFAKPVDPATAATWCARVLCAIADGRTPKQAFDSTAPISSFMNVNGGEPRYYEASGP